MMNLKKELFEEKFGTWWSKIEPLFNNGTMDKIYEELKSQSNRGKKIAPISERTFRCFIETPLDSLKVVILGLCPYHTVIENKQVADGLCLSCSNHSRYFAPSLDQFLGAIEQELYDGLCLNCDRINDLTYLANQGVLLMNAALTVEILKPKSHNSLWEPFTKYVFQEIIGLSGVPVIFLGREAAKFEKFLGPMQWSFKLDHPASASYKNEKWQSKGVFKNVNKILKDMNNEEINWLPENPPF